MRLRIICFEDNPNDANNLKTSFIEKGYDIDFLYYDLNDQWNAESERGESIVRFDPDLAIVDLADEQGSRRRDAGFRVIRKLLELQESPSLKVKSFPVIAWSKWLKTDESSNQIRQKALAYGAIPIFKPRRKRYAVAEILRKAALHRGAT